MKPNSFNVIDWRTFRSSYHRANNDIVIFTPIYNSRYIGMPIHYYNDFNYNQYNQGYQHNQGYQPLPPQDINYANDQPKDFGFEQKEVKQDDIASMFGEENIVNDYRGDAPPEYDQTIIDQYEQMQTIEHPDLQYQENDREKYFRLRNNFELSQSTFWENCSYLNNVVNSGALYEHSQDDEHEGYSFSIILGELESIVWGIYTSTDDMFFVITSQELYETGKTLQLKGLSLEKLIEIRDNSYELILIIKKGIELMDLTQDEKEYLVNRVLLLKDLINQE